MERYDLPAMDGANAANYSRKDGTDGLLGVAATTPALPGDGDGDGDVDDSDPGTSFSGDTGPIAVAVPERTSLALLTLGGLLASRRRRA